MRPTTTHSSELEVEPAPPTLARGQGHCLRGREGPGVSSQSARHAWHTRALRGALVKKAQSWPWHFTLDPQAQINQKIAAAGGPSSQASLTRSGKDIIKRPPRDYN